MTFSFDSFHGTILQTAEIAGLTLTETAYAPNVMLPKHAHQTAYFCYVLEGGYTEIFGNRSRDCRRSILIFHPAGETHADSFHAASRCFNVKVTALWLERIKQRKVRLDEPADFRHGVLSRLAAKLYHEFYRRDEVSSLVIEGLMLELLGETVRRRSTKAFNDPPLWLARAREFLNDRFDENLSLTEIARAVGVHETHLAREFRRFYGSTPGEFVRECRIEFARRRLSHSKDSLVEIAHAAGFFDQSHFTRNFKSQTGTTPLEYRKIWLSR